MCRQSKKNGESGTAPRRSSTRRLLQNRLGQVTDACQKYGGFYLGSIGGPAAILAKENIRKVELVEFGELGMEAVWKIDVVDFPAFILVDDKGNDFFQTVRPGCGV